MLRALLELASRFEDGDAGAFRAYQGAGDVKAVFRQQLIEVVAGDAARNVRKALADGIRVGVANPRQAGIDFAPPSAGGDDAAQLLLGRCPDGETGAVIEKNVERLDVIDGLAAHESVYATGIVTDHAADRAPAMRRRIGSEGELVLFRGVAQRIEHDPRLNAGKPLRRIQLEERMHIFREVQDHGHVRALPGQTGAPAAGEHGRA